MKKKRVKVLKSNAVCAEKQQCINGLGSSATLSQANLGKDLPMAF